MKIIQPKPRYIRHGAAQIRRRSHLVEIPWVETCGHSASIYKYNNGVHAALHSILAGMGCAKIEDMIFWLEQSQAQLNRAVEAIRKPRAKVVPGGAA